MCTRVYSEAEERRGEHQEGVGWEGNRMGWGFYTKQSKSFGSYGPIGDVHTHRCSPDMYGSHSRRSHLGTLRGFGGEKAVASRNIHERE